MGWECVTLKATESNQFQWSTAKIHKKKLITHVISSLPTTKLENCIETAVFADKKEGNAFINAFSSCCCCCWCCCWCKPPDLVRKYTCVTWPALRCSIILCQDRVQRSAAFKAAEVCCSRLQHHTLLQQKPGRMFANSRRARAHSHGHARDYRHGHVCDYYHGHKKHIIGIAHGYSHGHARYILAVSMTLSMGTQKFTILSIGIILVI